MSENCSYYNKAGNDLMKLGKVNRLQTAEAASSSAANISPSSPNHNLQTVELIYQVK
jgi:hypothetical protein